MAALDSPAHQGSVRDRLPGATQETVDTLRTRADQLRSQLAEEDLPARAQQVQELATERARELEGTVRERLEDFEPAARQAQVGLWKALRALFAGLVALPAFLFKVLRWLAGTLDDVAERTDIEERAKRATELLPDRRPPRVRRRTALLWTAGGFGAGLLGGWLLARRQTIEVVYDEPQPEIVDPVGGPGLPSDPALRG
jgi:uncharacterized membrane protein YccC